MEDNRWLSAGHLSVLCAREIYASFTISMSEAEATICKVDFRASCAQ
jgi:hypothetical protein